MLRHVIRDAVEVTSYCSSGQVVAIFSIFIDYNINNIRFQACICVASKQRLSPEECACLDSKSALCPEQQGQCHVSLEGCICCAVRVHVGKEERLSQTHCCGLKGSGKETELTLVLRAIRATQIQNWRCQGLSEAEVGFSTVNMQEVSQ